MTSPRYLTKSRFKLAAECPTKLFYTGKDKVYRNKMQEDSFLAMLADGGYQVGSLAKCYYPDGEEVNTLNHKEALAETTELLERENVTIFEAAVAFGDLFVRIDILIKQGNEFQLIEVKAKSYNSSRPEILGAQGDLLSGMRPYIEDVAFQAYVFRCAYPESTVKTYLILPDKAVPSKIDGLNQLFKIKRNGRNTETIISPKAKTSGFNKEILALVPVDEYVDIVMTNGVKVLGYKKPLAELATQWASAYKSDKKIKPQPGSQCAKCEFKSTPGDGLLDGFKECWTEKFAFTEKDFAEGTVLDLWNFRGKDKLINDGRVRLSSVTEEDLNLTGDGVTLSTPERQWFQANGIPEGEDFGGYWLSDGYMREEMSKWVYPYHFIDFETSSVALPFYAGMKPYEQVAFQFSHHVMHKDGRVEHVGQYLNTEPGQFPNFDFARELKGQLDGDRGTIFMWSPHENTILNRIVKQLQETHTPPADAHDLMYFLKSIVRHGSRAMCDLCKLSRAAYYHKDTKGSSSIKKVLPSILAVSDFLKEQYSNPNYGSKDFIPSKNYKDYTWWVPGSDGKPTDPYELLREYGSDLIGEEVLPGEDPDELVIAEGGAAATAHSRLQFEDISIESRAKINAALLRYCELDTLAMVMIVQGWKNFLK